jgi:hypothetical protein
MTTYGTTDQVENAQEVLDQHLVSSATGLCLVCGVPGPCRRRETAAALFFVSLRLPRRTPGATRPELLGARRVAVGSLPTGRAA